MNELYEAGDIPGAVEYELRMWVDGPDRGPDAVDPEMRERVREMNAALFARDDDAGEEIPLDPPAAERLAEISAPTLIVYGDKDVMDVRQAAGPLAATIPGARLAVIPDAAHLPQMERPELFNEIVLGFLLGLGSSGLIAPRPSARSLRSASLRSPSSVDREQGMAISSDEGYISNESGTVHIGWRGPERCAPGTASETTTSPPSSH